MMADNLIRSNRPDGRFHTLGGLVHHRLKTLEPRLAFDPSWSADEAAAWRSQVRSRLRRCLGIKRQPKQPAPALLSEEVREGYRLQRWELYPLPHSVVPMLMLIPDSATRSEPLPAVLCLPGSDHPVERLAGEAEPPGNRPSTFPKHNPMGLHFVKSGFVALCLENPGTGSMAEPLVEDWMRNSFELIWMGESYEGISVMHALAAYRWMRKLPVVDQNRVAACGHSLGAKAALLLGVLEPRVRAVVWNSLAHDYREYFLKTNLTRIAPWQYVPGFICWFDYLDLMAALAPMPLMLSEGAHSVAMQKVRKAYELTGAEGRLTVNYVERLREASGRAPETEAIPEGISQDEYRRLSNAGVDQHRFQYDTVVPWMVEMLK